MLPTFKDLPLEKEILQSIDKKGFLVPSDIQLKMIPHIIKGEDVVAKSPTGTGKTLAYVSAILSKMKKSGIVQSIILVPTRELALQVTEEFICLDEKQYFNVLPIYGGSSVASQISALKKGVDVIVGTPGRVIDLMKRGTLKLNQLDFFVLDEADEMLNMGFEEDIQYIFDKTNLQKQVLLLSATMPDCILKMASKYMKKGYQHVLVEEKSATSSTIKQFYYLVNSKMRTEAMCRVLDEKNPKSAIIFCQTKKDCDFLLMDLLSRGYRADVMHGDIPQSSRIQVLERFKKRAFQYLIATDVAARGIHVDHIDLIVNYEVPKDMESYIHRVGRTGRAFTNGEAISFVTPKEFEFLRDVMKRAQCTIMKQELPSKEQVLENIYQRLMANAAACKQYDDCFVFVRDMNKEQLLRLSASLLKITAEKQMGAHFDREITIRKDRRNFVHKDATRIFLTVGKMDGLKKGSLLDFLKEQTQIRKENFKNIDILGQFTFIDVENKVVDTFLKRIKNKKFKGRIIRAEKSKRKNNNL